MASLRSGGLYSVTRMAPLLLLINFELCFRGLSSRWGCLLMSLACTLSGSGWLQLQPLWASRSPIFEGSVGGALPPADSIYVSIRLSSLRGWDCVCGEPCVGSHGVPVHAAAAWHQVCF